MAYIFIRILMSFFFFFFLFTNYGSFSLCSFRPYELLGLYNSNQEVGKSRRSLGIQHFFFLFFVVIIIITRAENRNDEYMSETFYGRDSFLANSCLECWFMITRSNSKEKEPDRYPERLVNMAYIVTQKNIAVNHNIVLQRSNRR